MPQSTTGKYKLKYEQNGSWLNPPSGVQILALSNISSRGKAINVYIEQWMDGNVDFMIASSDGKIAREMVDMKLTFIVSKRYASSSEWYIANYGTANCVTPVETNIYLSPAVGILKKGEKVSASEGVIFYYYNNGVRTALNQNVSTSYTNVLNKDITLYIGRTITSGTVDWEFYSQDVDDFDEEVAYDSFLDDITDTDVWIASTYEGLQVHCVANDKIEPKTVKLKRGNNSYILCEVTLHALEKPTKYGGA